MFEIINNFLITYLFLCQKKKIKASYFLFVYYEFNLIIFYSVIVGDEDTSSQFQGGGGS